MRIANRMKKMKYRRADRRRIFCVLLAAMLAVTMGPAEVSAAMMQPETVEIIEAETSADAMENMAGETALSVQAAEQELVRTTHPTLDGGMLPYDEGAIRVSDLLQDADALENEQVGSVTEVASSELSAPQRWTLKLSGRTLTVTLHDEGAADGTSTMVSINAGSSSLAKKWGSISDQESVLSVDLSDTTNYPDGQYSIRLWEAKSATDTTVWSLASYPISLSGSTAEFVDAGKGAVEMAMIEKLNADYDPADYSFVPAVYFNDGQLDYGNTDEIMAKAEELTAGIAEDDYEGKVRAIHDWICSEFAYDYEAYLSGSIQNSATAGWVFENKKGVCSGFARMCNIMFTAVGVPTLNMQGYANGNGISADRTYSSNHEWNAVYLNGSWRVIDVTWDCENKDYGSYHNQKYTVNGAEYTYENSLDNAPTYVYYGTPAFSFGQTHNSLNIYAWRSLKTLTFSANPTKTTFQVGDTFSCDAKLNLVYSDETIGTYNVAGKESMLCSGYDMAKAGLQTVTITYQGRTITYDIVVNAVTDCIEHTYGEWQTVRAATCVEKGLQRRSCSNCDFIDEAAIDFASHQYATTYTIDQQADCAHTGSKSRHCTVSGCDAVTDVTEIPATGAHSYGEWTVTNAATCAAQGVKQRSCSVCGGVQEEKIAMTAHQWNEGTVTKQPTAQEEGVRTYTCSGCGLTKTESIAKLENTGDDSGSTGGDGGSTGDNPADADSDEKKEMEEDEPLDVGEMYTDDATGMVYEVSAAINSKPEVTFCDFEADASGKVVIPDEVTIAGQTYQVTAIDQDALKNQKNVREVTIGKYVKEIGEKAFYGCSKLKKVTLGSNVRTIKAKAFYKCKTLSSITIPARVTSIGKQAFYGCSKLKTIRIKTKKLTDKTVGSKAFGGIYKTASFTVPKAKKKAYQKLLRKKGVTKRMKI